jgi:hypothetical protein
VIAVITSDNTLGTVWPLINLALSVALLVVALAALHTSKHWTQHKQRNATVTPTESQEKNSSTTLNTRSKHSGLGPQPPPATYATYPSCQETLSKLITLMQETQTVNYLQRTEGVTPVGVVPPSHRGNNQPTSRQTSDTNT